MPVKGGKHTEESKQKMREAHAGIGMSAKVRSNMSIGQKKRRGTREDRFFRRVRKTKGCWLWEGGTIGPYGLFGPKEYAHRVSYEMFVGPIHAGNHVHHVCGRSLCVRPDHLKQVTPDQHKQLHT